jgi:hypothetical protein
MTPPSRRDRWRGITGHVAVQALFKSVLVNMIAPALLYRLAAPYFPQHSLAPLAISGAPPILSLAHGLLKLRAVDFLGLFAAENIMVSITALLVAHSERGALIGRALQNVVLAAVFLASMASARPLVFHMARQLSTGNNPAQREAFDTAADRPGALRTYRRLTLGWTLALLIKAAGTYGLASHLLAGAFLLASPLWDLASDSVLLTWSLLYGRRGLGQVPTPRAASEPEIP